MQYAEIKDEKTSVREVSDRMGTEEYKEAVKEGENLYRIKLSDNYYSKGIIIENAKKHKEYFYARINLPETVNQDSEGNPLYNHMPLLGMGISDVRTGISKSSWSVKAYNNSEAEKSVFSMDRTALKI